MMTVAPVASAGDAASYYSGADNYYFLDSLSPEWYGKGAEELGLNGAVDLDTFTDLMFGKLPDGTQLGREIQGNHVHRPGHDFTFTAPKSISLLILMTGDRELLDAHHEAVHFALSMMEEMISARDTHEGVTAITPTGKMVAALFTHDTSRNLDPGIHTHAVVANVTELDGKWKALATDTIHGAGFIETMYKNQTVFGSIYRNHLRTRVEALGHDIRLTGDPHGMWEVAGIPENVLDFYSSRHNEIRNAVGPDASLKSLDVAAKDTRQAKVDLRTLGRGIRPAEAPEPERTMAGIQLGGYGTQRDDAVISKPETADGRRQLLERWNRGMTGLGFDLQAYRENVVPRELPAAEDHERIPDAAMQAVRAAISTLSDSKTRFTSGDLLLTAHESGQHQQSIADLRAAVDQAISEDLLIPLDREKGVYTSAIHLMDELSVQALTKDIVKEGHVARFSRTQKAVPEKLLAVEKSPLAILNAPSSLPRLREVTEELVTMSRNNGREVRVLASTAERANSLSKSAALQPVITSRFQVMQPGFELAPNSTLIVEGAERIGLKEMLVITGEAREKNAQLLFLDSAGRRANGNALAILESAGAERYALTEPTPGISASVISIIDKRDRYRALAERYADLTDPHGPVTAIVVGEREQKHLTGLIRDELQNAGRLERDGVNVEARSPVFMTVKTRKLPGTYQPGMVLEDRREAGKTAHYVIDRVHQDTRMLSVIDTEGVLSRVKLSDLSADWRLFTRQEISISAGEQLVAVAADKAAGLKARDRLSVTAVGEGVLTLTRDGQKKAVTLDTSRPLYVAYGYVSAPGARDNETGTVLAALNASGLSSNMMSALAQSGQHAEIFTGEVLARAEEKLGRMRAGSSPLQLVTKLSGNREVADALETLKSGVLTTEQKAVSHAVEQMTDISFTEPVLLKEAMKFSTDVQGLAREINRQIKEGDLIKVRVNGQNHYVARSGWESEKTILSEISAGKNAVIPLMNDARPFLPESLTRGQSESSRLVLESADRFTLIQGFAGTGKTTQFSAVTQAVGALPDGARPRMVGLAPTHRAVKEMRAVGVESRTMKSFMVDWQQRTSAGETVSYHNTVFLVDEASMLGNQDMAAAVRAIAAGGGRAVIVGDEDQFTSPESGSPFRLMKERSPIDVAVMKQIVRQRDASLKAAVYSAIDNKPEEALTRIEQVPPTVIPRTEAAVVPAGSVAEVERPVDSIIADWISRTPAARASTMIITQLNADRREINQGIHQALASSGELGEKALQVRVLERISGGRTALNRLDVWQEGQIVMASERYFRVVAKDSASQLIHLQDDGGRLSYLSPATLNASEMEVFSEHSIELREGDSVRLTKTRKDAGHAAHEEYKVVALRDNGELLLRNGQGDKVINPSQVQADQHLDYAWAVTGYGAQGASADYVIALEGTDGARKVMSGMRAFYINASRARDHVQIYTDGREDWVASLKGRGDTPATAHDALVPENSRQQARGIWAMGQPLRKTAIGRAFIREQGIKDSPVTARIIPATHRFPDPHLALPVYDGNGKAAGVSLIPLTPSGAGVKSGEPRLLATTGAEGALLQRSRNGETVVVRDLRAAMTAIRDNPLQGVLLQTGDKTPSGQLLRISGGSVPPSEAVLQAARQTDIPDAAVPDTARLISDRPDLSADQIRELIREAVVVPGDEKLVPFSVSGAEKEDQLARALAGAGADNTVVPADNAPVVKPIVPDSDQLLARALAQENAPDVVRDMRSPGHPQQPDKAPDMADVRLARALDSRTVDERQLAGAMHAEQLKAAREIDREEMTPARQPPQKER